MPYLIFVATLTMSYLTAITPQIIIMRHGESDHNITNTYNSDPFSSKYTVSNLTEKGKGQVRIVAKKLQDLGYTDQNIETVYVSPLPRTLQTSDVLAEEGLYSKSKVVIDLRINETQFENLEGAEEISDPDLLIRLFKENHVEPNEHIKDRLKEFYNEVKSAPTCGNILVITHAYNYKMLVDIISKNEIEIPDNVAIEIMPIHQ